jgi:DNA-damage-inducible protein J
MTGESMSKSSQISARISSVDKKRAEMVFETLGVTASQAITLFYKQVYLRKGIPFPVEIPNQETLDAIEEARAGEGKSFESVDALMKDLGV